MDELLFALPVAALLLATPAVAQEFRIETEVFVGDNKEPVAESLTIFSGDVVYDFLLGDVKETTMFDIRRGRIVLLDPLRKLQTSLTTDNLLEFSTEIKARAGEGQKALFSPQFRVEYEETTRQLSLTSEAITYRVKGVVPRDLEAVKRYQQFADWYARLNTVRTGNLPPFGRIELNKALAERNLVPEEVERTVVLKRFVGGTKTTARSVHVVNWLISNTDRKHIDDVGTQLANYTTVPLKEFCEPVDTAKTK